MHIFLFFVINKVLIMHTCTDNAFVSFQTEQIFKAEDFDQSKEGTVSALIDKTISAIQMLEDDYVHKD